MREREPWPTTTRPTRPTSDATYQALSHELLAKEPEKTNEGEKRRNYFTRLRRTLYHHGAPFPSASYRSKNSIYPLPAPPLSHDPLPAPSPHAPNPRSGKENSIPIPNPWRLISNQKLPNYGTRSYPGSSRTGGQGGRRRNQQYANQHRKRPR